MVSKSIGTHASLLRLARVHTSITLMTTNAVITLVEDGLPLSSDIIFRMNSTILLSYQLLQRLPLSAGKPWSFGAVAKPIAPRPGVGENLRQHYPH